jgi:salicyl acyltransferaes SsfX3-like protein
MDTIPITPDLVRGALELEHTQQGVLPHRLPAWARAQGDGQLAMAEAQPSGVRLALRTRATVVELDTLRTREGYRGIPPRPDGVYDLLVDGELTAQVTTTGGKTLLLDMATGAALGDDRLGVAAPAYGEGDTEPVLHPKRGGLQAHRGFGDRKLMLGGSCSCSSARTVLMNPASPRRVRGARCCP